MKRTKKVNSVKSHDIRSYFGTFSSNPKAVTTNEPSRSDGKLKTQKPDGQLKTQLSQPDGQLKKQKSDGQLKIQKSDELKTDRKVYDKATTSNSTRKRKNSDEVVVIPLETEPKSTQELLATKNVCQLPKKSNDGELGPNVNTPPSIEEVKIVEQVKENCVVKKLNGLDNISSKRVNFSQSNSNDKPVVSNSITTTTSFRKRKSSDEVIVIPLENESESTPELTILTTKRTCQTLPITPKKSKEVELHGEFDSDLDTPPKAKARKLEQMKENCVKNLNELQNTSNGSKKASPTDISKQQSLQRLLDLVSDLDLLEPDPPTKNSP